MINIIYNAFVALLSPLNILLDTQENMYSGLLYIGPYCTVHNLEGKFKHQYRVFSANVCVLSLWDRPDDL
jgi:hypothetical protein